MLLSSVMTPLAFDASGVHADCEALFCSASIGILSDCLINGLLFVDNKRVITQGLLDAIQKWPAKYSKRGLELFSQLENRKRLIECEGFSPNGTCSKIECRHSIGVAANMQPSAFLSASKCLLRNRTDLAVHSSAETFDIPQYGLSAFSRRHRDLFSVLLLNGEWSEPTFTSSVWRPLLEHSKHVKIIDRYIGRGVGFDKNKGIAVVKDNYRRGLEWIFSRFVRVARGATRTFEVYCGFLNFSGVNEAKAAQALRTFGSQLAAKYSFPLVFYIKKEGKIGQMPHGRFLLTDQVDVLIERGFDLLWSDKEMMAAGLDPATDPRPVRDVMLTHFPSGNRVEVFMRTLPDVP